MKSAFMIGFGKFLFRYRSLLFPAIFIGMLFVLRPRVYLPQPFYDLSIVAGFLITMLGEAVRVLTIGLDYIERGGRKGSPFASKLVRGGIYTHVRNPMYVGNLMMAVGVGLYSGAPAALVTVVPFFFFIYYGIISAEENFLRKEFGSEYEDFCRSVNRLWPSLKNIGGTLSKYDFNGLRAAEKDNGTAFYTFLALTIIPLWRMHFLGDAEGFRQYVPVAAVITAVLVPVYAVVRYMAKTGRLVTKPT